MPSARNGEQPDGQKRTSIYLKFRLITTKSVRDCIVRDGFTAESIEIRQEVSAEAHLEAPERLCEYAPPRNQQFVINA